MEERFAALGPLPLGASAARASHDAAFMRRLYQANLPAAEMARAKDLLRKLAAIDAARAAAEAVRAGRDRRRGTGACMHARAVLPVASTLAGGKLSRPCFLRLPSFCHRAQDQQALAGQLKAAEGAHRQAEFARARAEAIATARRVPGDRWSGWRCRKCPCPPRAALPPTLVTSPLGTHLQGRGADACAAGDAGG